MPRYYILVVSFQIEYTLPLVEYNEGDNSGHLGSNFVNLNDDEDLNVIQKLLCMIYMRMRMMMMKQRI